MPRDTKSGASVTTTGSRLWWLILGRLATATLLLVLGVVWTRGGTTRSIHDVTPIFLVTVILTLVYSGARLAFRGYTMQARAQLFLDVLLVTWLVWSTDDIHSPY